MLIEIVCEGGLVDPSILTIIESDLRESSYPNSTYPLTYDTVHVQIERHGYFVMDSRDNTILPIDGEREEVVPKLILNRTIPLKSSIIKNKGKSRKEEQMKRAEELEKRKDILPENYFRELFGDEYSEFDDEGIPIKFFFQIWIIHFCL